MAQFVKGNFIALPIRFISEAIRSKLALFFVFLVFSGGAVTPVEAGDGICALCHKHIEAVSHKSCTAWMKDGHPVFVKPSSNVVIPPIFPLSDKGEITCETCHIEEYLKSKDYIPEVYSGKIELRFSNEKSSLCKRCHVNEFNKEEKGRNHPIEKTMDKIPRRLLESEAIATGNMILCQTCHKMHSAKGRPLLVMPDGDSMLCGYCHPKHFAFNRKGATHKGTHPIDIVPVTATISKTITTLGGKKGGPKKIICLTCHRIHQAPDDKALLITDAKNICAVCHKEYLETITGTKHDLRIYAPDSINKRGQKAKKGNVCSPCHLPHNGEGAKMWARPLSGEGDIISQLCNSCHQENSKIATTSTGKFSHIVGIKNIFRWSKIKLPLFSEDGLLSSNKRVTCATCHDVHQWDPLRKNVKGKKSEKGTKTNSFLRIKNTKSKLCKVCHSALYSIKGTSHDPANSTFDSLRIKREKDEGICEGCHTVHNGKSVRLWKFDPGEGDDFVTQICNTCHESDGIAKAKTVGSFSHPMDVSTIKIDYSLKSKLPLFTPDLRRSSKGLIYCNTCHDVHNGPSQKQKNTGKKFSNSNYLRIYGKRPDQLCLTCHQNKKYIKNTKHDFVANSPSHSTPDKQQGLCNPCHNVHRAGSDFKLWFKPIDEDKEPTSQMCKHCHAKEGIAKNSALEGHSHPVDLKMSKRKKDFALPLYDNQLKKRKRGKIQCPTCHNVHQWEPGKEEKEITVLKGNYENSFLRIVDEKGLSLCLECHPNKEGFLKSKHDLTVTRPDEKNHIGRNAKEGGVCSPCHLVHRASSELNLWARKTDYDQDKTSGLCKSCHARGLCAEEKLTGGNSHPVNVSIKGNLNPVLPLFDSKGKKSKEKGMVACASCHDAHTPQPEGAGTTSKNSFLRLPDQNDSILCNECHPSKTAIIESRHNMTKDGQTQGVCSYCHKMHNSKEKINLWARNLSKVEDARDWLKNAHIDYNLQMQNKLCMSCHTLRNMSRKNPYFTAYHPGKLFFTQLEIEQKGQYNNFSPFLYQYGNIKISLYPEAIAAGIKPRYPVFDQHGSVSLTGDIACPTCHDIHQDNISDPSKKKLLRENVSQRFCSICHSRDAIYRYQYFHVSSMKKTVASSRSKMGLHFKQTKCLDCHRTKPTDASNAQILFDGDVVKLCESCHDGRKAFREKHPVGMEMVTNVSLHLKEKKITCTTCHDIKSEHAKKRLQKTNPSFLYENESKQAMTYTWTYKDLPLYAQNRYNLCYKCHDNKEYQQFSPHKRQINRDTGEINKAMCLLCHSRVPDRKTDRIEDFHLNTDIALVCIGCHPGKKTKHPLGKTHYNVTVSPKTSATIRRITRTKKLFIPIVDNKISCSSCHNAHEKGVLRNSFTRKGDSAKGRLRFGRLDICSLCHRTGYRIPSLKGVFPSWK